MLYLYAFASTIGTVVLYLRWRDAEGALKRQQWVDVEAPQAWFCAACLRKRGKR